MASSIVAFIGSAWGSLFGSTDAYGKKACGPTRADVDLKKVSLKNTELSMDVEMMKFRNQMESYDPRAQEKRMQSDWENAKKAYQNRLDNGEIFKRPNLDA